MYLFVHLLPTPSTYWHPTDANPIAIPDSTIPKRDVKGKQRISDLIFGPLARGTLWRISQIVAEKIERRPSTIPERSCQAQIPPISEFLLYIMPWGLTRTRGRGGKKPTCCRHKPIYLVLWTTNGKGGVRHGIPFKGYYEEEHNKKRY